MVREQAGISQLFQIADLHLSVADSCPTFQGSGTDIAASGAQIVECVVRFPVVVVGVVVALAAVVAVQWWSQGGGLWFEKSRQFKEVYPCGDLLF